jgi:hypothetical protein
MSDSDLIRRAAAKMGIHRLCHFTPSRNLIHIADNETGVLSTARLKHTERAVFNQTDLSRLDGHEGYVCCSIQYPNAWYFDKVQKDETLFKDWVILFISPEYLWRVGTLFCQRNASAEFGKLVSGGYKAFMSLYADEVIGAYGRKYKRGRGHPEHCPTDQQAEVLVPDEVPHSAILAVAVRDEAQARREAARLRHAQTRKQAFKFVIAPILYDKYELDKCIRAGTLPPESIWKPSTT